MAGSLDIKRRIKSVRNTKKITKAMELVSASKMKRAVASAVSSRPYAHESWALLEALSSSSENTHELFSNNGKDNTLVVLITSNRGLCGAYNAQIIRKVLQMIKAEGADNRSTEGADKRSTKGSDEGGKNVSNDISFIAVGKKGENALRRLGKNIVASFLEIPENATLREVLPIGNLLISEFKEGKYGKVVVAYTDFFNPLVQKPILRQLLPVSMSEVRESVEHLGGVHEEKSEMALSYTFEPGYDVLMSSLVEKLTRSQVYQMLLESSASEQSSRMMAMKNASEAAGEMIDDLTLAFNKARQAAITKEISEISAGMASVS